MGFYEPALRIGMASLRRLLVVLTYCVDGTRRRFRGRLGGGRWRMGRGQLRLLGRVSLVST
jgi:hypothetical protein